MKRPIDLGNGVTIGQRFGEDPATYNRFSLAGHHGQDFPSPLGRPIYAPENGVVTISDNNAKDQYTGRTVAGETIVVRGPSYEHWLMHLSVRQVGVGQHVMEGQAIGFSGNTGFSTGPHLHWGVRPNNPDMGNGYRGFINPNDVLQTPETKPSGNSVTLPAHVPTWAAYRVGSGYRKGTNDQVGTLLPSRFGGLTYDIVSWIGDSLVTIDTKSFGQVAIWVKDTDAVISRAVSITPVAPPAPPIYNAPSAPINISSPKYGTIVKDIAGYLSATNAINHTNPVSTVKAGSDYFVFTNKYGMDNVTLISGQPGAWINPNDNVPDPPPPVIVPVEEPKRTQEDIKKDWVLPPVSVVIPEIPVVSEKPVTDTSLPTPTPEPETPEYQAVYHPFSKPVWYKAITDTFVQDMQTNELIALSENRELPIHGTFIKDLVLYGRATKKGSEGWYGVPLNDLNLALTPQQKLEKVANTVLNDPVFIDSARPTFDRISHTIHTTDMLFEKAYRVFDIFVRKPKK